MLRAYHHLRPASGKLIKRGNVLAAHSTVTALVGRILFVRTSAAARSGLVAELQKSFGDAPQFKTHLGWTH